MINESCAKIGRKMKAYRSERGLSQQELAEGICSSSTISLIETGQHFPAVEIMQKLTEKLGVPLQEILNEEENNLELNTQIDIAKIYVETKQFAKALEVIHEVEKEKELREFQKRELILYRAECLMQTGEAQQAINILSDLQQKLEQLRENDDSLMARVYDKLGTAYYFASNFTNAHAHYFRAYQLTTRFPQFDVVAAKIVYNLGMVCRQLNRFREAIEFLTQAESFFKDHQDQKRLAQTYLELGISYKGSQHFELADHYLKESLALLRALNVVKMFRRVRRSHALVVLSQTNPALAIEELMTCALEYEQEADFVRSANTNAHLAHVLLSVNKSTEAGIYLQKAISQLKNCKSDIDDYRIAFVYQIHAQYLLEINDLTNCITCAHEACALFQKSGFHRNAADSLNLSAQAHSKQGNFQEAYSIAQQVNELLVHSQDHYSEKMEVF